MIEHVMAALAGLQIDNCRVELDAPEPPGMDGSSQDFTEALLSAGSAVQAARKRLFVGGPALLVTGRGRDRCEISYRPVARPTLAITYHLDYGPRSPIPPQELTVEITPETFKATGLFADVRARARSAQVCGRPATALAPAPKTCL